MINRREAILGVGAGLIYFPKFNTIQFKKEQSYTPEEIYSIASCNNKRFTDILIKNYSETLNLYIKAVLNKFDKGTRLLEFGVFDDPALIDKNRFGLYSFGEYYNNGRFGFSLDFELNNVYNAVNNDKKITEYMIKNDISHLRALTEFSCNNIVDEVLVNTPVKRHYTKAEYLDNIRFVKYEKLT